MKNFTLETLDILKQVIEFRGGKPYWLIQPRLYNPVDTAIPAGSIRPDGYRVLKYQGRQVLAHRFSYWLAHGCLPKLVDHRNRVKDDNTPGNLRAATDSQNKQNMDLRKNNTSGIRGVGAFRRGFRGRITIDYKEYSKTFKTLEAAVQWRKEQAELLHPFRPEEKGSVEDMVRDALTDERFYE